LRPEEPQSLWNLSQVIVQHALSKHKKLKDHLHRMNQGHHEGMCGVYYQRTAD
jgi:hypothetical protein